jgi:DNA-binding transcriptional MerR regulator
MVYENNNAKDNSIRGKALYFSTSQVANSLNISDSRVRYYTNVFDDILHVEVSNKQRRYTQIDIDKMKFMIELKEEGMTIKQIQEYCQEVNFEDSKEIQIKENNPLSIQAIAKALLEQQAILINDMKQDIIDSVISEVNKSLNMQNDNFNDMKNSLSKEVAMTVEDVVDKELKKSSENLEAKIEESYNNMGEKIISENRKELEDLKKDIRYISQDEITKFTEQSQPKGFLSNLGKLFHNKK